MGIFFILLTSVSYVGGYVVQKFSSVPATSINTRFDELSYYLGLFKKNFLFGYGMINPQYGDSEECKKLVHGVLMKFSITDIGIVGQMARSGVLILVWYLCFIKYVLSKKHLKRHICMSVYILLSSINLVVLDTERMIIVPFVLTLYEMDNIKCRKMDLVR